MGIKSFAAMERQGLLPPKKQYGSIEEEKEVNAGSNDGSHQREKTGTPSISWKLAIMTSTLCLLMLLATVLRIEYQRDTSRARSCVWKGIRCHQAKDSQCWIRPSDYETCLGSIHLDTEHFVKSIEALDATFQQWYPFYNQAAHPLQTRPSRIRVADPNIKYRVYSRDMDLHEALQDAIDDVRAYGASVASVWDVSEVFNWLRDAHLNAIKGAIGNLTSDFWSGWFHLDVFPEETWNKLSLSGREKEGGIVQLKTVFYYDDHLEVDLDDVEALRLNLERYDEDGNLTETRPVVRIDNLAPGEFVRRFAKDVPLRNLALRSVGPRVNALIGRYFPTKHARPTLLSLFRPERIRPRHIFPADSFLVDYADGTSETFYVGIAVPPKEMKTLTVHKAKRHSILRRKGILRIDLREMTRQANQPACLYRNFHEGMSEAGYFSHRRRLATITKQEEEAQGEIVFERACSIHNDGWFTKAYECSEGFQPPYDDDGPLEMAYKVMGDYIVFKLDSFDAPPDIIFPMWKELNRVAAENGIRKLIIDLSDNGGGEVPLGLNLAQLMYPEVPCEMFENKYDMLYNEPMALWAGSIAPLLEQVGKLWTEMRESDKERFRRNMTRSQRRELVWMAKAMCILDSDHDQDHCGSIQDIHERCPLLASAELFKSEPSLENFADFVKAYLIFMDNSNPWTVLEEYDVHMGIGRQAFVRGGKMTNFTNFLPHEPDFPTWWECQPLDEVNVFGEYILVSNGNAGSTANTFQTTVEQIWKHRKISGARRPLTTVSYGGLGERTPLTQFAGGTVDSRVNTEVPYAGMVGFPILARIFPGLLSSEQQDLMQRVQQQLRHSLPPVPYYFAHFSQLPAVEIYNKFLWESGETVPLEFIYFPPDVHIRDVYAGSIFDAPEALEGLYRQAAQFFRQP